MSLLISSSISFVLSNDQAGEHESERNTLRPWGENNSVVTLQYYSSFSDDANNMWRLFQIVAHQDIQVILTDGKLYRLLIQEIFLR
jgi:hypothetical protein